jgi:hypothetical protein
MSVKCQGLYKVKGTLLKREHPIKVFNEEEFRNTI